MKYFKVTFLPWRHCIDIVEGSTLLEAAERAGIVLNTSCGGRGICGKCKVKILPEDSQQLDFCQKSAVDSSKSKEIFYLACRTKVAGNCIIYVPSDSLINYKEINSEKLRILTSSNVVVNERLKPFVRKLSIQLGENKSDFRQELCNKLGFTEDRVLDAFLNEKDLSQLKTASGVTVVFSGETISAIEPSDTTSKLYGIAIDIGTTTLAASLLDLNTARQLGVVSRVNPQNLNGDDVISRIHFVREKATGLEWLRRKVIEALNEMIEELAGLAAITTNDIYDITMCGNTAMQQLACGIDSAALGEFPFSAAFYEAKLFKASSLGLNVNPCANAYIFPQIGGFVGGDVIAGIIAAGGQECDTTTLFVDIGTNGEVILIHHNKIYATSAAAGPAFEGARIHRGMRAASGAIEHVFLENNKIILQTIDNMPCRGICGSGLIDAVACMLEGGIVDRSGLIVTSAKAIEDLKRRVIEHNGQAAIILAFAEESFSGEPLLLLQNDIRQVQLGVGAIRVAISFIMKKAKIGLSDISQILVAGAFGSFINPKSAIRIGLLPNIPIDQIHFLGNAALQGAKTALLWSPSRQIAEKLRSSAIHIELSSEQNFQEEFAMAMIFP